MRRRGLLTASLAALTLSLLTPLAVSAQEPRLIVADGVGHEVPSRDIDSRTNVTFRVILAPRHQHELDVLLREQRDPTSPRYHRYISSDQFAREFQPTPRDIAQLVSYFTSFGVSLRIDDGSLLASARGTARHVEELLHTDIAASEGKDGLLVARDAPTLPQRYASLISGVVGLSRPSRAHHHVVREPRNVTSPPTTCANAQSASGLSAQEQANLYGLDQLWSDGASGQGHTIALYELAQYRSSDLAAFFSCYGIAPSITSTSIRGGASGYDPEVALDIEQAAVLAPGATLAVYQAPNDNTGPVDLFAKIARDNTSDIVSISWGICEAVTDAAAEAPIFQQMAAQGQTVIAATGDAGSSDCQPVNGSSTLSVDDPASQPYVTAVGGTHITSFSPFHEVVWNNGSAASGGGVSAVFSRPGWQAAPGMDSGLMREIPDLSLTADSRVGFPTYYNGRWTTYGGTSIGAPILSGLLAVAAESCATSRWGFLNPMLYSMARRGVGFRDITEGTNDLFHTGSYSAGVGYDMATGLGSPDPTTFVAALCPSPPSPDTSVISVASASLDRGVLVDLALRDTAGALLATTTPTVIASQAGAHPVVTVLPPVAFDSSQRIVVTTDRPGTVALSVSVGGVNVASTDIAVTSPVRATSITTPLTLLRSVGGVTASTMGNTVIMAGQRANHQVVAVMSDSLVVRNFGTLIRAPLASSTPSIDCWRSICSLAYRSGGKVIVITNIWSTRPRALTLTTASATTGDPHVAVLTNGTAVSYTTATNRLGFATVSDAGQLVRLSVTGANLRGTPEIERNPSGRARVIVRTTAGLAAYSSTTTGALGASVALQSSAGLTGGPFLVGTNPDVVIATRGNSVEDSSRIAMTTTTVTPATFVGVGSGMFLIPSSSGWQLWCSTPSWRTLDVNTTLGVTLVSPVLVGSGGVLIVTSGSSAWAFTR